MNSFFLLDTVTGDVAKFSFIQSGSEIHIVNKFHESVGKMVVKDGLLTMFKKSPPESEIKGWVATSRVTLDTE